MKRKYKQEWFKENGPLYKIEVSIVNDIVTLMLDTSGDGLHKRGYRKDKGEAPLRENLAAAMVILSKWDGSRIFADPLCGSGTIAIEAALIGNNIAPGLNRSFVSENWPGMPKDVWQNERNLAKSKIDYKKLSIFASDINRDILEKAKINARNAGVLDYIIFERKSVQEFYSNQKYGCIVCNPPYGERMGDLKDAEILYRQMGETLIKLDTWSFFILSAHPDFQKFFGKTSNRNRKLYNGNLKTYLYQYFGPLPHKINLSK